MSDLKKDILIISTPDLDEMGEEMLKIAERLEKIKNKLSSLKELLKIDSESLREKLKAYRKLQEELQNEISEEGVQMGNYFEFFDYPKLVLKVNGEDFFEIPANVKTSEGESSFVKAWRAWRWWGKNETLSI